MAVEQIGNTTNYTGRIDPVMRLSMWMKEDKACLRLTLEVFHDIEKSVIHVGLIAEAHFDLVEVAQSILVDMISLLHLRDFNQTRHPSQKLKNLETLYHGS